MLRPNYAEMDRCQAFNKDLAATTAVGARDPCGTEAYVGQTRCSGTD